MLPDHVDRDINVIAITDSNWPTSTKAALKARAFIDIEYDAHRSISGLLAHPLHHHVYTTLLQFLSDN